MPIPLLLLLTCLIALVRSYEVPVSDHDSDRQICSGMWAGKDTYINVTFKPHSQGQLAMVIYNWDDVQYLGKQSLPLDDSLPKTYICTDDAMNNGLCQTNELGHFIYDLPPNKSMNDTSFWSARLAFPPSTSNASDFWNNPNGNPTPPDSEYDSPWKARQLSGGNSPPTITPYTGPINYRVSKTSYYCVAIVPLTIDVASKRASTTTPHPAYQGSVLFKNVFNGKLPASDYPKVTFYLAILITYVIMGGIWAAIAFKYRDELLPVQYYISGLIAFLITENMANFAYYRYLNVHGSGAGATAFLIVVSILDAGRNALSFFLLLIVSLGLSIVRESLGKAMLRCRILTAAHFIFGVLYAVGVVELQLESTSALVLLLFVIPLAFTLSGFMLWIMYALNGTITELQTRKQHYKTSMFRRLYYILIATAVFILAFFVISSFQFSNRLAEDYAANSWRTRWWLLDGFLVLLYLIVFWTIAYFWRPTEHNRRLAMSDELAQDDNAAEDYEFESLQRHHDEEQDTGRPLGMVPGTIHPDSVVFDIGDPDSDDEGSHKRTVGGIRLGNDDERAGLISENARKMI